MATLREYPKLGRYEVINRIASGGMAEVFLAKATGAMGFQRLVALKLIHANFTRDDEFVKMFIDEARIAMHLHHRNIVQVFDLDKVNETYFIAMEYVHGVNLYDLYERIATRDRWVEPPLALYLIAEICKGLHFAHTRRDAQGQPLTIVHRDVSPQNVLMSFEGEVKITDFGIATAAQRLHQTAAGIVKGKYAYMAPERLEEKAIDARVDVFSAGVLLYELLVGENPFAGPSAVDTIDNVLQREVPPPSTRGASSSRDLDAICLKALAKNPDDRFRDAQAFGDALTEYAMDLTMARKDMAAGDAAVADLLADLFEDRRQPAAPAEPGSLFIPGVEESPHRNDGPSTNNDFGEDNELLDLTTTDEDDEFDAPTVLKMGGLAALGDIPTPPTRGAVQADLPTEEHPGSPTAPTDLPPSEHLEPTFGERPEPAQDPTVPSEVVSAEPDWPRTQTSQAERLPGADAGLATIPDDPNGNSRFGRLARESALASASASESSARVVPAAARPSVSIGRARPSPVPHEAKQTPAAVRHFNAVANEARPSVSPPSVRRGPGQRAFMATGPGTPSYSGESMEALVVPVGHRARRPLNVIAAVLMVIALVITAAAIAVSMRPGPTRDEVPLQIATRPPGAVIKIDGQALAARTPTQANLPAGSRVVVTIELPGHDAVRRIVRPQPGESLIISETLRPIEGQLIVMPTPPEATVIIDGSPKGKGRVQINGLPLDSPIEVRVELTGYTPFSESVRLSAAQPRHTMSVPLAAEAAPPRRRIKKRRVMLTAPYGSWATVYYKGQVLGSTPAEAVLPVGKVTLRVRNDEIRLNKQISVRVPRSGSAEIKLSF